MKVIIYTDGSFKPNVEGDMALGCYGSGAHGYVYDETKESKVTTDAPNNFYITETGYISSNEYNPDTHKPVVPTHYIDAAYSFLNKGTVGKAELLAMVHVLKSIIERREELETEDNKINDIYILADSNYAIGEMNRVMSVETTEEYIDTCLRPDTANRDILIDLKVTVEEIKAIWNKSLTIRVGKVSAHSLHIGNDIADDLAYLAREMSGKHKLLNAFKIYKIDKGKRYWSFTLEESELLKFRQLFFTNSLRASGTEVIYSVMNYKTDVEPGTRTHDALMGLVCLKHPQDLIEDAIEEYHKGLRTMSLLSVVNLRGLYSREVSYYYDMFGKDLFTFIYKRKELVKRNLPIVVAVRSPGLANKLLMDMQYIYDYINYYRILKSEDKLKEPIVVNGTILYKDISDVFYGKDKKNKQVCVVPQGSTFVVVNVEWDKVKLKYPLSLGKDTLERNQFKKMETKDVRVFAVVEKMSDKSYRYYTIVEVDNNLGVYANLYSNKIILE